MDGGLPYDHSSSLQSLGEGIGSEIEKCHVHPLCPTLLWPMQSFTAGHREAKTLAVFKGGFPGPWDKQEHPVLKKDSHCAFSIGRAIAQGQSSSGSQHREGRSNCTAGSCQCPNEGPRVGGRGVLPALAFPGLFMLDQLLVSSGVVLVPPNIEYIVPEVNRAHSWGCSRWFCPVRRAQGRETLWGAPCPEGRTLWGPWCSLLLPAPSDLKERLCLAVAPALAAPSPAQVSLCREVQGKGKILREAGEGGKQALREGAQHGLKAPSQRAFVRPGRAQRRCQPRGAVLAPVAPGDPKSSAACPAPRPSDVPVGRMQLGIPITPLGSAPGRAVPGPTARSRK